MDNEERERQVAEAIDRDLSFLWEYAQDQLIVALLFQVSSDPATQLRILKAHQTYTNAPLRRAYSYWRIENPDGNVEDFLNQAPPFALPSLRGGSKAQDPIRLYRATKDYEAALALLRFKRVKEARLYRKLATRKQVIKKAVQEALGLQEVQGKRKKEFEDRLNEWQHLPREDIALEAAA